MSEVVRIDFNRTPVPRTASNTGGNVHQFTQALNLCTLCGSSAHRASKCQLRVQNAEQPREI